MIKLYKILFFNSLISGTLLAVSSYSWLSMWIGLEINLLSIIPLMSNLQNIYPSEAALKYFITQVLASALLMFSIIMNLNLSDIILQNLSIYTMMMMNSAFLIKMGAAPFHAWFPEVMEGLNWMNSLLMLTWQKIAPMALVMYNIDLPIFTSAIVIFCAFIGGTIGLNQISLRKILAYSSITHIGWMLASMLNNSNTWIIYFLTYSLITVNIIFILNQMNIFYLSQLFMIINNNKLLKILFIFNFMSLGGLPPFLGFLPKWLTIYNLSLSNYFMLSIILISMTLITLYFYLRVTFSSLTINSSELMISKIYKNSYMILVSNFIALSGLLICTYIFTIL
nr:NADH dehydrogenase subunit 2 [Oxypeltus quadrispinosus]